MTVSAPSPYLSWDILRPDLNSCQRLWVRILSSSLPCSHHADPLVQISELAIFGECVAIIAWLPTAISITTVVLRYALRSLWRRRPIWLRNFAAEDFDFPHNGHDHASGEVAGPTKKKTWARSTLVLLTNSLIGLIVSILAAFHPQAGPLFLTPCVTHVSEEVRNQLARFRDSALLRGNREPLTTTDRHHHHISSRPTQIDSRLHTVLARPALAHPAQPVQHYCSHRHNRRDRPMGCASGQHSGISYRCHPYANARSIFEWSRHQQTVPVAAIYNSQPRGQLHPLGLDECQMDVAHCGNSISAATSRRGYLDLTS